MKLYLISIYQPGDGTPPSPEVLAPVMREMAAIRQELEAQGNWFFAGGLHPPSTATVLRSSGADVLVTDGPFAEAKEHLGGFTIVRSDDYDAVLGWAERIAGATGLPVEVRPFVDQDGPGQKPTDR